MGEEKKKERECSQDGDGLGSSLDWARRVV